MSEILTMKEEQQLDWFFMHGEWELEDLMRVVERMIRDHGGE